MTVEARLDGQGVLHIRETQVIEMNGAWNGGERTFNATRGRLLFDGLSKLNESTGQVVELPRGELSAIDHWNFTDRSTLRWRSRKPHDPPFDHQRLTYVLEYRLTEILQPTRDGFRLNHDFAMLDRDGMIETLDLTLSWDPVWNPKDEVTSSMSKHGLAPGDGLLVSAEFVHSGDALPSAVHYPRPTWIINLFYLLTAMGVASLWRHFKSHDEPTGRWPGLGNSPEITAETVSAALDGWQPEELGALWDQTIGSAEVAAVISRMVGEGKLASTVEDRGFFRRRVLALERLRVRGAFEGYDRKLINKLFFNRRKNVDTLALRKHYRNKGLDLVKLIKSPIESALRNKLGTLDERVVVPRKRTAWLVYGSIAAGVVDLIVRRDEIFGATVHVLLFLYLAVTLFAIYLPSLGHASRLKKRVDSAAWHARALILAPVLMVGLFWVARSLFAGVSPSLDVSIFGSVSLALWICALSSSLFNGARTRLTPQGVTFRRKFSKIRCWMAQQLRRSEPELKDEWFPHLVAFGLDHRVDKWFKTFAGTPTTASMSGITSSSGASSSLQDSSWTGGGGSFGGAGATAAWASAAASFASGVSAASSGSSGSSGGGGGGGSSGGGGGGGW